MRPTVWDMHCPVCRHDDTKVIDSRPADEGAAIRRRRSCPECAYRFTTYERLEGAPLMVLKRSGDRQPFDRAKVADGIRSACKGRPVSEEMVEELAEAVEEASRETGADGSHVNKVCVAATAMRSEMFCSIFKAHTCLSNWGLLNCIMLGVLTQTVP